jgi:hypothetical protein
VPARLTTTWRARTYARYQIHRQYFPSHLANPLSAAEIEEVTKWLAGKLQKRAEGEIEFEMMVAAASDQLPFLANEIRSAAEALRGLPYWSTLAGLIQVGQWASASARPIGDIAWSVSQAVR